LRDRDEINRVIKNGFRMTKRRTEDLTNCIENRL
jgi:hypothetical protein